MYLKYDSPYLVQTKSHRHCCVYDYTVLQLQNRFTVSWKSVVWSAAAVRTWPGLTLHCYGVSDDVSVGVILKILMIVCCGKFGTFSDDFKTLVKEKIYVLIFLQIDAIHHDESLRVVSPLPGGIGHVCLH